MNAPDERALLRMAGARRAPTENVYGRPRQSKDFLKVVLGGAVEFLRVSGLMLRLSTPRALMAISRVGSKSAVRA